MDKEQYKKLIKALYLRVVITHSYYHDLSYIHEKCFDNILEVIYLIVKDICKNENISINEIESISSGGYSGVLIIGNKVIKVGLKRETPRFPNNPYIVSTLLRKEIPINKKNSVFIEVSEKVDTKSEIFDEELYQLYKKIRNIHLIWLDVEKRNVGRLLKDNLIYWREELPITDKTLGLDQYRGNEVLKKGEIVILDNDLIYDEKSPYISNTTSSLQKKYEKRYQNEKKYNI